MVCYYPVAAWPTGSGLTFTHPECGDSTRITIPCRKCIGCRLDYARDWQIRLVYESEMHQCSSFITLTYSQDNCPISLQFQHTTNFLKRLRKALSPLKVRYFLGGEYGEQKQRPHYHAIIFGYDFPDKEPFDKSSAGNVYYRSDFLEQLWPFGFSSVGSFTTESAGYVARYAMKKQSADWNPDYTHIDSETGEVTELLAESCRMSRRPGIAREWLEKYWRDIYPADFCLLDGKKARPPPYFDNWLKQHQPETWERVKERRHYLAENDTKNRGAFRRRQREIVKRAQIKKIQRNLK